MKYRIIQIFLIACLGSFASAYADRSPETTDLSEVKKEIYQFRFDNATRLIADGLRENPKDLPLNFYDAFVDFLKFSQDVTKTWLQKNIEDKLDRTIDLADERLELNENDINALYYKGMALGVKGLFFVVKDSYLKAYWYGSDGLDMLETVAELDPDFVDVNLGLGLFSYYVDLMPGIVKFFASILGLSGSREDGLEQVRRVAKNGNYFKVEAQFSLAVLYYFIENDLDSSIVWLKKLQQDYPENPLVNLLYGVYYRKMGKIEKAKYFSKKVFQPKQNYQFGSIVHGAYYNYGQCFFVTNDLDSALIVFEQMNSVPTRKSTYFRSTIDYWRGYLYELKGDSAKALVLYKSIHEDRTTKRWFDFAINYINTPLTPFEKKVIVVSNELTLDYWDNVDSLLLKHANLMEKYSDREKGRYFFLQGQFEEHHGEYHKARSAYLLSVASFEMADFDPMRAMVYMKLMQMALNYKDLRNAEAAYDEASNYSERYFKIKLRPWWARMEKMKREQ